MEGLIFGILRYSFQMEAKPVKMRLHFFYSAVITNSKLDYYEGLNLILKKKH